MTTSISERKGYTAPVFKLRPDGVIEYNYTETRKYSIVHNSKFQSEDKNDIVERKTTFTGTIYKDGLIRKGKSTKEEKLIKRGRMK